VIETTEAYGFTFAIPANDTAVGRCLRDYGEFGRIGWTLCAELAAGRVFVDVGANIGGYALPVARRASAVVAIEAQAGIAELLRRNVEANGLGNITVVEAAAGREAGVAEFPVVDLASRANFGAVGQGTAAGKTRPTPVVTLDDVAPADTAVVKIDVEGAELDVLAGARRLLDETRPFWLVEANGEGLLERLTDAGYRCWWFWDPFVTPLAPKREWEGPRKGDVSFLAVDRARPQPLEFVEAIPGAPPPRSTAGFEYLRNFRIPPIENA
jgi:FkbM family methyltransferase